MKKHLARKRFHWEFECFGQTGFGYTRGEGGVQACFLGIFLEATRKGPASSLNLRANAKDFQTNHPSVTGRLGTFAYTRTMYFVGLGTATPPQRFTQRQCWEVLRDWPGFAGLEPRSQAICRRVFGGSNGIESRYLAFDRLEEAFALEPNVLHARFARHAPAVATEAAERALQNAGLAPGAIDALLVSTCTGYLCPGLTSYVAERLGLRSDALLLDLVGQGCGAAVPNLRTAEALLASGRCRNVLSVCVEICSAAFYIDNDPGVLISNCLFGDGGAAAVLSAEAPVGRRKVRWVEGFTALSPNDRDCLRFETRDGMLRNILGPEVPGLAARHVAALAETALHGRGLGRDSVSRWILHAGGRDVLKAVREALGLDESATELSAEILREHGNLSSPFVLFVLAEALRRGWSGGWWWMASFGAGFSSHGALLEVE